MKSIQEIAKFTAEKLASTIKTEVTAFANKHKYLAKLAYVATKDVEPGNLRKAMKNEAGIDPNEIQHVYELRNVIGAVATGATKLTEAQFDNPKIVPYTLVIFNKFIGTEHEEKAIEIMESCDRVRPRLKELGKPAEPHKHVKVEVETAPEVVETTPEPDVVEVDAKIDIMSVDLWKELDAQVRSGEIPVEKLKVLAMLTNDLAGAIADQINATTPATAAA